MQRSSKQGELRGEVEMEPEVAPPLLQFGFCKESSILQSLEATAQEQRKEASQKTAETQSVGNTSIGLTGVTGWLFGFVELTNPPHKRLNYGQSTQAGNFIYLGRFHCKDLRLSYFLL